MYLIELSSNEIKPKKIGLIVTKKQLKQIEHLQTLGGFLRYQVDIYSDTIKTGKLDKEAFSQFMFEVFGSSQVINYFFKPIIKENNWFEYLAK
jgi:hypothetical protein